MARVYNLRRDRQLAKLEPVDALRKIYTTNFGKIFEIFPKFKSDLIGISLIVKIQRHINIDLIHGLLPIDLNNFIESYDKIIKNEL